jgi:hypothetical protein
MGHLSAYYMLQAYSGLAVNLMVSHGGYYTQPSLLRGKKGNVSP